MAAFLPNIPEAISAMLAVASIGASATGVRSDVSRPKEIDTVVGLEVGGRAVERPQQRDVAVVAEHRERAAGRRGWGRCRRCGSCP